MCSEGWREEKKGAKKEFKKELSISWRSAMCCVPLSFFFLLAFQSWKLWFEGMFSLPVLLSYIHDIIVCDKKCEKIFCYFM